MPKQTSARLTETQVKDRLYELYNELVEAEENKRDLVKAHGENIKRIKAEIKDLLNDEAEADNTVNQE